VLPAVLALLAACSGDDVGDGLEHRPHASARASVHLNGAVQKGPFIVGSSIRVSNLDEDTNPTGLVFSGTTHDDMGHFELEFEASDLVSIEGTGFYYNEITGSLSGSALTLRAFYEVGSGSAEDAFVNVVTHLTYDRVRLLVVGGLSYDDARSQAEQELNVALAVAPPGFVAGLPGVQMNVLGGDSDGNAYLLAVSTVLAQAALLESPDSPDAALQELLNHIALDLAQTGGIDPARSARVTGALAAIPAPGVEAAFAARYPSVVVPDLDRILDQDADGLVNAADDCPTTANPAQDDLDLDGQGDDCDDDRDGDGAANAADSLPNDPNEWTDADGVGDSVDNCLGLANADQLDTDADLVGDACDPDAPSCNAQTEGYVRCSDQHIELCSSGDWVIAQTCDFWCTAGACNTCYPGHTFCDLPGGSTPVTAWECDENSQLRRFESVSASQSCMPPDFPSDISALPIDTNPPRWLAILGSRWAEN
jgi:hypothetical protein